jgi:hypothetical protein
MVPALINQELLGSQCSRYAAAAEALQTSTGSFPRAPIRACGQWRDVVLAAAAAARLGLLAAVAQRRTRASAF